MSHPSETHRTRVVVHLGPMKTGTTALAVFLSQVDARGGSPAGLFVPRGEWWPYGKGDVVKHHQVALLGASASRIAEGRGGDIRDDVARSVAAIGRHARESGASTVLFIAEGTERRVEPASLVSALRAHFDDVSILWTARHQRYAVPSLFAHRARARATGDLSSKALRRFARRAFRAHRYDYPTLVRRWSSAGVPVLLVPYLESDKGGAELIARTLDALGVAMPAVPPGFLGRLINPTPSTASIMESVAAGIDAGEPWRPQAEDQEFVSALYAESNRVLAGMVEGGDAWDEWFVTQSVLPLTSEGAG